MADIQVANTDADLSGNTLVTEEEDYTITGLHTFARSATGLIVSTKAVIGSVAITSEWTGSLVGAQLGGLGILMSHDTASAGNSMEVCYNAVSGAGNNSEYMISSEEASKIVLSNGINFQVAGTGTAGDTISFTDALTITSAGNIALSGTITAGTWEGTDIGVAHGGTGASSLTDGGILLGSGTGAITALGVASNGQIPIGDGSGDPQLATITGTSNEISVANGAGSITIGMPDDITIGTSLAVGASAVAAGDNSLAAGYEASAAGDNAMALGYSSSASADHSFAIGYDMTASASHALGLGYQGTVSATHSVLMTLSSTSRTLSTGAVFSVMDGSVGINTLTPGTELDVDGDLTVRGTGASALDVGGGINVGTGNVALVGTDGKINGPLSSTIIDDLSGANLTTLNASNISSGTLANARLPTNVDLGGTLDVTGATTLDSTLDVVGNAVFNDAGADKDFRIESSGTANMFVVDGGLNSVSFGLGANDYIRYAFAGAFTSGGSSTSLYGFWNASALTGHADDSSGISGMRLDTSAVTAGNATLIAQLSVNEPQITVGAGTVTNSASVYVQGQASEATNNYSLWVDAGDVRFDGATLIACKDSPYHFDIYASNASGAGAQCMAIQTNNGSAVATDRLIFTGDEATSDVNVINARLGVGFTGQPDGMLHVQSASAGSVTPHANADELVVEGSAHAGMTILAGKTKNANIFFGDEDNSNEGSIYYSNDGTTSSFNIQCENGYINLLPSGGAANGVGIGVADPDAMLEVNGVAKATGGFTSGTGSAVKLSQYNQTLDATDITNGYVTVTTTIAREDVQNAVASMFDVSTNVFHSDVEDGYILDVYGATNWVRSSLGGTAEAGDIYKVLIWHY